MKQEPQQKHDHPMGKKSSNTVGKNSVNEAPQLTKALETIARLEEQLHEAQEKEKRSRADYQNLVRRTQEERAKSMVMANREIMGALIQPLEHLHLAATQLKDAGLTMVVGQLQKALQEFGLEEVDVMGKEFTVETMEAVEKQGEGKKVVQVVQKGYKLNGTVLQHAKVILG